MIEEIKELDALGKLKGCTSCGEINNVYKYSISYGNSHTNSLFFCESCRNLLVELMIGTKATRQ